MPGCRRLAMAAADERFAVVERQERYALIHAYTRTQIPARGWQFLERRGEALACRTVHRARVDRASGGKGLGKRDQPVSAQRERGQGGREMRHSRFLIPDRLSGVIELWHAATAPPLAWVLHSSMRQLNSKLPYYPRPLPPHPKIRAGADLKA